MLTDMLQLSLTECCGESAAESDMSCVRCRLATQMEEMEALRATLKATLQAKAEDLQLYNDMMSQVKQVFLHALRQHKQDASHEG